MQKRARRRDFHVKIYPEIKALFKQRCIEQGFSTCFIIETLIQGWLASATRTSKAHPSSTLTINQNIEYVVDRPRRKKRLTLPMENCYTSGGFWTYRRPNKGEVLSKLGHVAECKCLGCIPSGFVLLTGR